MDELLAIIWNDDVDRAEELILREQKNLNEKINGVHLLQFALRLQRYEICRLLLKHNAMVLGVRDDLGFSVFKQSLGFLSQVKNDKDMFDEVLAISKDIFVVLEQQKYDKYVKKLPKICELIQNLPDMRLEIDVSFRSSIPLVTGKLPKDTIYITKREGNMRIDYSLTGFEHNSWTVGKQSIIFTPSGELYHIDYDKMKTSNLQEELFKTEKESIDKQFDLIASHRIVKLSLVDQGLEIKRSLSFWKNEPVTQIVNEKWNCSQFDCSGLACEIKLRPRALNAKEKSKTDNIPVLKPIREAFLGGDDDKEDEEQPDSSSVIKVPARKAHTVRIRMEPGQTIEWRYKSESRDISFQSSFRKDDDLSETTIAEPKRVNCSKYNQIGEFCSDYHGVLYLVFDNSYSMINSKKITLSLKSECDISIGEKSSGKVIKELKANEFFDNFVSLNRIHHLKPIVNQIVEPKTRKIRKSFTAKVYVTDEFPINVEDLLVAFEVLQMGKAEQDFSSHISKFIRAFQKNFELKQFPVKFELMLIPAVTMNVEFKNAELYSKDDEVETDFSIPVFTEED
eukprot:TRINITY_DN4075_c0_g1_i1.p1 TRINITY_DN4075_c0_g1~~TRINITY_DN4075_c0_g1_i1.p1  ORF type:complete len:566 (+),score=124.77 TRINITY_DN4075_c0_g1_i1:50-1747(+)